jgi:DNA polymerase phi
MLSFRRALIQSVTDACEGKILLTAPQVKDLLKLASFGMRHTHRITSEAETRRLWDPEAWEIAGQKLTNSERFKGSIGLQKMCQKISTSQTPSTTKRKAYASGDEAVDPPVVKRKKTRN